MTQIDTMGPAQAFLGGASAGLQLRGQMQQADQFRAGQAANEQARLQQASQFDARMAQDQSQFGATLGLNTDIFNAREERARMELERELRRARLRADHARGGLAPRGGLPIPGNGLIIFTPPGEDDDFHAMLDEAGDDPELMDEMAQTVLKGADARMSLRSYLANLQREGLSEYADQNGKMGKVVAAWKNSTNPRTIEMAMKMVDELEGRNQAIKAGAALGIPPQIAVNMTPAQLAQAANQKRQFDSKVLMGDEALRGLFPNAMPDQTKAAATARALGLPVTLGDANLSGQTRNNPRAATINERPEMVSLLRRIDDIKESIKMEREADIPNENAIRLLNQTLSGAQQEYERRYAALYGGGGSSAQTTSTTPAPGAPTQASSAAVPNEDDDARALAAFRQKFGRDPADDAEFEQFIGGGGL